jgi:hypothetical protein
MKIEKISMDKIITEKIDPFKPEDQIVETRYFNQLDATVTLYYGHKKDSMMVKVESEGVTLFNEPGARITFNHIVMELCKTWDAK